ncbi:MAG: HD domain-containing protein [Lachnospiraceae bacterium]|nr:HD domain-containing protein [Lachnospiraceae bacterium]
MNEQIIEAAKQYIQEIFKDNSDGHDAGHSLRVYVNAMKIAEGYPDCNRKVVALAALLHDVDDHKLFDTKDNGNAVGFLKSRDISDFEIELICEIINAVSFSKNKGSRPGSLEGKIVQDADRLDAIGAIGIARTFAYGGKAGRPLASSIEHFHEKLLLLKDLMNTEEAREMAKARHAFMEEYLAEFQKEDKQYYRGERNNNEDSYRCGYAE